MQGEGEIDEVLDETDEVTPFRYSVTTHGVDYPVDALIKRISEGAIVIPEFQRGYVWSLKDASRFVESLLLGLPVPSIFLSRETETQKLLVVDGHQRLFTLKYFYQGVWPATQKVFSLKGVQKRFENATYETLAADDRRRLNDAVIHAIVVRQDEPSDDSSSIYHIFERLNTTGVSLTPQEIRTAIHRGEFTELLRFLSTLAPWREVYGPANRLMRDQELILRFLALYFDSDRYAQPMKEFLTGFLGRNKHLTHLTETEMRGAFAPTIETIAHAIGKRAFRTARVLNAAAFDSVMVGVTRRLQAGPVTDLLHFRMIYDCLVQDSEFLAATERATANEETVAQRLRLATRAFSDAR